MTLPELQSCLDSLGINLSLRLVVDAPAEVMTSELRNELANHKPALVRRLVGVESSTDPAPIAAPDRLLRFAALAAMPVDECDRQERAAIYEFDAGMSRADAERLAGVSPVKATGHCSCFLTQATNRAAGSE